MSSERERTRVDFETKEVETTVIDYETTEVETTVYDCPLCPREYPEEELVQVDLSGGDGSHSDIACIGCAEEIWGVSFERSKKEVVVDTLESVSWARVAKSALPWVVCIGGLLLAGIIALDVLSELANSQPVQIPEPEQPSADGSSGEPEVTPFSVFAAEFASAIPGLVILIILSTMMMSWVNREL